MSEYIITTEQLNWFLERMDETVAIPAAIAHLKPVVRCRDCKRFHPERLIYNCEFKYPREENVYQWRYTEPDGYCPFGERKKL